MHGSAEPDEAAFPCGERLLGLFERMAQRTSYGVTVQSLGGLPVGYLELLSQCDLSDVRRSQLPSHGKDLQREVTIMDLLSSTASPGV